MHARGTDSFVDRPTEKCQLLANIAGMVAMAVFAAYYVATLCQL
jgi:hypothetical protein